MASPKYLQPVGSLVFLLLGIIMLVAADEGNGEDTAASVLDWLQATPNFFLNPKIKYQDGNFIVEEAIEPSELLMMIPNSSLLVAPEPDEEDGELCELLHVLWKEIDLRETSAYAPYVRHLQDAQSSRTIAPVLWSNIGKRLLNMISITLPRSHITTWIEGFEECLSALVPQDPESCEATDLEPENDNESDDEDTEEEEVEGEEEVEDEEEARKMEEVDPLELSEEQKAHLKAFDIAIQHQINQRYLVPLYDQIQDHHYIFNVNHTIEDDNSVRVVAVKEIATGESLQRRTLTCLADCDDSTKHDTVTSVLRNYGRVQSFPQFWTYPIGLSFLYDPTKQNSIEWVEPPFEFWNLEIMENEYAKQLKTREREIKKSRQSVPEAEWRQIDAYSFALIQALKATIVDGYEKYENGELFEEEEEEEEEGEEGDDDEEAETEEGEGDDEYEEGEGEEDGAEEYETEELDESMIDEEPCDNACFDKGVPLNASDCEEAGCYLGDIGEYRKCPDYKYNSVLNETEWVLMRSAYIAVVGPKKASIKLNYWSGMKIPYRVGYSVGRGRGVFTVDDIPKGTLVWTSEHTAAFETGLQYRQFLRALPDFMVCDLLIWCYTARDNGGVHYIGCDLDEGSLFNTYDVRAEYNIGGLKGTTVNYKSNEHLYSLRDITAGEELVTSYGSFDTDDFGDFGL